MSSYTLDTAPILKGSEKALNNMRSTRSVSRWVCFNVKNAGIVVIRGEGETFYSHVVNGDCENCIVFADVSGRLRMVYNDKDTDIPNRSTGILVRVEHNMDIDKVRVLLAEYVNNVL